MSWQRNGALRKSAKLRKGDISKPTNFVHRIHADYDPLTGDLRGLPTQWETILGSDFLTLRRQKMHFTENEQQPREIYSKDDYFLRQKGRNKCHNLTSAILQDSDFHALIASLVNTDKDPRHHFARFVEIGVGSTGRVFRADSLCDGRTVAIKCMNITEQKRRYLLLNEILIPRELGYHPNLTMVLDSFLVVNQLWVVSEFAEMGSLTRIVTQRRMTEALIATVSQQVLRALNHLHERRIVHRDVKSDSILICADGTVKLSDFGFCARLTKECPRRRSLLGTPYWLSAQVAAKEEYGTDADIWSYGITIFEMIFGAPPYFELLPELAVQRIISEPAPQFPPHVNVSPELGSFTSLMLQKDPIARASAKQLLRHPFLRKALPPSQILSMFDGLQA